VDPIIVVSDSDDCKNDPRAFTSHIPEENTEEYNLTENPSFMGNSADNGAEKRGASGDIPIPVELLQGEKPFEAIEEQAEVISDNQTEKTEVIVQKDSSMIKTP
jgi:hypothetical protein